MGKEKLPVIVSGFKESVVQVEEKENQLIIRGLAVPFNKISSNGVMYNKESLIETLDLWEQCPVMYNHMIEGESLPIGKIISMTPRDTGLYYEVEIDKTEEKICNKIKNGYLKKVSIHILPKDITVRSGYQEAMVKRPLEFSVVPVPGFMETDMEAYMEKINTNSLTEDISQKEKQDLNTNKEMGDIGMEKKPRTSIKEKIKHKQSIKERIDNKIVKRKEMIEAERENIRKLKETFNKKYASRTDIKNILSLMEEIIEVKDDSNIEEIQDHESALKDAAEVLETVLNRLDRIEEMLSDIKEENENQDSEEVEGEDYIDTNDIDNDSEVENDETNSEMETDEIEEDDKEIEEKIKQPKRENVRLSFNDLESRDYSKNILKLN